MLEREYGKGNTIEFQARLTVEKRQPRLTFHETYNYLLAAQIINKCASIDCKQPTKMLDQTVCLESLSEYFCYDYILCFLNMMRKRDWDQFYIQSTRTSDQNKKLVFQEHNGFYI